MTEKIEISSAVQLFVAQEEARALRELSLKVAAGLESAERELAAYKEEAARLSEMVDEFAKEASAAINAAPAAEEEPDPASIAAEEAREALEARNARVAAYIEEFIDSGARNDAAVSRLIYDMKRMFEKED